MHMTRRQALQNVALAAFAVAAPANQVSAAESQDVQVN